MAAQHVLVIGPHGLIAIRCSGRGPWRVTGRFGLGADVGGAPVAAFAQWLRSWRADRFDLIVDLLDEEQHAEDLPRLNARDHALLVRRRIEQRFRDAEFSIATSLKATAERRRAGPVRRRDAGATVPMLLSAIRQADSLNPWVPALREAERAVSSMLSPALIAPRVARRIVPHASGLLACVGPAGLRQTLIVDGRLRFSRLTASIDGLDPEALRAELVRTVQYLNMAQVASADLMRSGRFNVWLVIDGIAQFERFPSTLVLDSGIRVPVVLRSLDDLGAPIVLEADGSEAALGALPLWLDPALRQPLRAGYANRSLRRHELLARARRALWTLGGAAAAAGALALAWVELAGTRPLDDPAQVQQRMSRDATERTRLEALLAKHPLPAAEMQALVRTAALLRSRRVDAPALLHAVSAAMPADTDLKLVELAWQRPVPGGTAAAGGAPGGAPPVPGSAGAGAPPPPIPGAAPPPPGGPVGASGAAPEAPDPLAAPIDVAIRGTVERSRSKTDANALVEAFAAALAAWCGCAADVREWPYDRSPGTGWTERFGGDAQRKPATWAITLRVDDRVITPDRIDVARR